MNKPEEKMDESLEQIVARIAQQIDGMPSGAFWPSMKPVMLDFANRLLAELRTAKAGIVEVPEEPTEAMIKAGYSAAQFPRDPEICIAMYRAMIAATKEKGQ